MNVSGDGTLNCDRIDKAKLKKFISEKTNDNFYEVLVLLLRDNINDRISAKQALDLSYFKNMYEEMGEMKKMGEMGEMGELNGGNYRKNNINVEYTIDDFNYRHYELEYAEQIVSQVGNIKIQFKKQNPEKLKNLCTVFTLLCDLHNKSNTEYILSENNIFNTLCHLRFKHDQDNDFIKYIYPLNNVFSSIDIYNYLDTTVFSRFIGNINGDSNYHAKVSREFAKNVWETLHEFIYNPAFEYRPIWTLIEYFHIIYKFNHKIDIDYSLIFNNIIYLLIGINENIEISLWEMCLYCINKHYKPTIFSFKEVEVFRSLENLEKKIDLYFNIILMK